MTALARWRAGAVVLMTVGALMPLALARQARGRSERVLAARDATAAAAYLTIVTPSPPRGGAGYDLAQLLGRARAVEEVPGFSGRFEIYHATAPLVRATAPPLSAATLQRLRREVAVRWTGEAALAPLLDRDGWDVVGAVAARPAAGTWPVSPWSLAALLLLLVAGWQSAGAIGRPRHAWRQSFRPYGIVAVLFGVAVFADLRGAAGDATDRWLYDTRLLMQEAAARSPEIRSAPAGLSPLARGAEIVPGDSSPSTAWRRAAGGVLKAAVAVRLAPGRWVELRTPPAEAGTDAWLPVMLGLAALGPLGALLYALYVPVSMALALGLAVMIGGRRRSGAAMSVLRALFLLPYASSVVAVALVWQWMYHPDFGLINQLLTRARLGPVNWLGDPRTALGAVMLVSVWMQLGYQLTVFLAGLRAIPQPYLDAARVDGASAWQRFWRVTFPLLSPVTLYVLVTGIIGAFQVFALVMVLTGGGPLGATDVIVSRIYRIGWELLQFGDASALALLLVAVLFGAP